MAAQGAVILTEMFIVVALILLNGVFAGAEIAILALRRTRVEELAETGSARAAAVADLRSDPERFLATAQVGITLLGVTAAAVGGSSIGDALAVYLAPLPLVGPYAERIALVVVVLTVSSLTIVLGELVPKSLALRAGESYALAVAPVFVALSQVARPVVWVLTAASNVVLRVFGDSTSFTEGRLSRDEIQQLVDEAATAGTVDQSAGEIASRALDFSDLDVATIMVPRPSIISIDITTAVPELADVALKHGHSRVLVYEGDDDNVIGFVNLREALARASQESGFTLKDAVRPVPFVPETMSAPMLLREMQRQRAHLAVVLDDVGTVRGIATIEDLVEELVGDILSENDKPSIQIKIEPDGSAIVDGGMPAHEVARALGVDLPEAEQFSTIAGLCIEHAGRIPTAGERFDLGDGVVIEVVDATARRIKRVRVHAQDSGVSAT